MLDPLNTASDYIDQHLNYFRKLPVLFVGLGVFFVSRHYYLFKTYSIHTIPVDVLKKRNIWLKCLIKCVNKDASMEVIIHPKIRVPLLKHVQDPINLRLASLIITEHGRMFLKNKIEPGTYARLLPISKSADCKLSACLRVGRYGFVKFNICNQLLLEGLASIDATTSEQLPDKILHQYIAAEAKAHKKNRGLWSDGKTSIFERILSLKKKS